MNKLTRWNCPNGCGGVLAPTRPRKDDVRRYCLDCSKRTGRLVERVSPALERKRTVRVERSRAKAQIKAKTKRASAPQADLVTRFRCGADAFGLIADMWNVSKRWPRVEVRRSTGPRAPHRDHTGILVLYDHDGCDRYDAKAMIFAAFMTLVYGCGDTTRGKVRVRSAAERGLKVRPHLDEPISDAWREIAGLLRAQAAAEKLGHDHDVDWKQRWNARGTVSGRTSTRHPNLSNFPRLPP